MTSSLPAEVKVSVRSATDLLPDCRHAVMAGAHNMGYISGTDRKHVFSFLNAAVGRTHGSRVMADDDEDESPVKPAARAGQGRRTVLDESSDEDVAPMDADAASTASVQHVLHSVPNCAFMPAPHLHSVPNCAFTHVPDLHSVPNGAFTHAPHLHSSLASQKGVDRGIYRQIQL